MIQNRMDIKQVQLVYQMDNTKYITLLSYVIAGNAESVEIMRERKSV